MINKIYQISEQAIICDFGNRVSKNISIKINTLTNYINNRESLKNENGITNCVPSYNKVLIQYDLNKSNLKKIIRLIKSIDIKKITNLNQSKIIELSICYDEEYGLDLKSVANRANLTIEQVINYHQNTIFYVYMIGFMPGLPFMGNLSSKIYTKRLKTPRIRVPERSVGIVEKFSVIYPYLSPGGWNIIGRIPNKLFIKRNKKPTIIEPGDTIKFKRISKKEFIKLESKNEK